MKKRILSIVLSVALIVMCIPMSISAATYEYTVAPGTKETIPSCVACLVDSSLKHHNADDEVTVYVTNKGTGDYKTPTFFGWRNDNTPHAATVTYTSATGENAILYSYPGANIALYGDSVFKNVNLQLQNPDMGVCTGGHSFYIDNTSSISYDGYIAYGKIFVGGRANGGTIVGEKDATITLDGLSLNGGNGGVILGAYGVSDVIPGNQTIILNDNTVRLAFAGNNLTTFSKNVNFVLNNASISAAMTKWTVDGSEAGATTIGGALQILANGASSIDADAVYRAATAANIAVTEGVYVMNSSNQNGSLELTPTAGVYKVLSEYTAVATNGANTYTSVGGYLTVPAGVYTVTYGEYVEPETITYTVAPGTNESIGSTVASLVQNVIWPEHNSSDKVTVYVSNEGTGASRTPNYFGWRNNNDPHTATVTYTTKPGESKATLYSGAGAQLSLYGDSIFRNINLYIETNEYGIVTLGHNLTLDSTVSISNNGYGAYEKIFIGGIENGGTATSLDDGVVTVDGLDFNGYNPTGGGITGGIIFGGYWNDNTVPGTQTLISKNNNIRIAFTGNKANTFEKNINVILENATASAISQWGANGTTTVGGAIQILANGASKIDKDAMYAAATHEAINAAGGVYVMDSSSQEGSLELTGVAGKFKVNTEEGYVAFAQSGSNIYVSENGYLTVPAGAYTVTYASASSIKVNGDIDGDGEVLASDLTALKSALLSGEIITTADVNGDGKLNILDLIRMKRYLAGADVTLEASKIDYALNSLSNTYYALSQEKRLTIGYIGGSITYGVSAAQDMTDDNGSTVKGDIMLSYANRTTAWFEENYPDATIQHVNAGISDTATNFGIYRLKKDLMNTNGHDMPDLVFVEFTSNDWIYENMPEGNQTHKDIQRQVESLVLNIYELNPNADIVFVFSARKEDSASRQDYIKVAEHYGLQYIDMGIPMQKLMDERGASNESAGSYYYTVDDLHPSSIGYGVYFEQIEEVLSKRLLGGQSYLVQKTDRLANAPATLSSKLWKNTDIITQAGMTISGSDYVISGGCSSNIYGTSKTTLSNSYITPDSVQITGEDAKISFTFTGTTFSAIFYMGSAGINMDYTIDGEAKNFTCDSNTAFSFQNYMHTQLFVIEQGLEYGEHTVELSFNKTLSGNVDVRLGGIAYAGEAAK